MDCPHCQKTLPENFGGTACPYCEAVLPPATNHEDAYVSHARFHKIVFFALLTPPLLTLIFAWLSRIPGWADVVFIPVWGGVASGFASGIMMGLRLGKTIPLRIILCLFLAPIMAIVCVTLCCFGCAIGGYQLNLH